MDLKQEPKKVAYVPRENIVYKEISYMIDPHYKKKIHYADRNQKYYPAQMYVLSQNSLVEILEKLVQRLKYALQNELICIPDRCKDNT